MPLPHCSKQFVFIDHSLSRAPPRRPARSRLSVRRQKKGKARFKEKADLRSDEDNLARA